MAQYTPQFYCHHLGQLPEEIIVDTIKDILFIAAKDTNKKVSDMTVLDVGSGLGQYAFELEKHVKYVVAVEPDEILHKEAIKIKAERKSQVELHNNVIEEFDTDKRFDLAISLTTVEHMAQVEKSFERIFKLLKNDGIVYITAPNKLWPYECHYHLYFLHWLPVPLANIYLKLTKKGTSFQDCAYSKTYFGMKRLLNAFPCTYYFILPPADASYIGLGDSRKIYQKVKKFGIWLIGKFPFMWVFSKGFIIVAKKNSS